MSVLDTMKAATPLVRRVTLCLDGALQSDYDAAVARLTDASLRDHDSLAAGNTLAVVAEMESARDAMAASEVTFSFGPLPWLRRMALEAEHPPREGNLGDRANGHNIDTYTVALIREACRSVQGVDGAIATDVPDEAWDSMLAALNYQQVNVLYTAAVQANDNATTVPPSARSLRDSLDSGASSKSPGPGTSPRNGSKGGSRSGTRKSSTAKKAASSGT